MVEPTAGRTKPTSPEGADRSVGALLRRLAEDSRTLIRQEIELARLEVTRTAVTLARGSAVIAGGVLLLIIGLVVLLVFAILALGRVLDGRYWLSTLLIGSIFAVAGIGLILSGRRRIRSNGLRPDRTIDSVRATGAWAQAEARDLKRELGR